MVMYVPRQFREERPDVLAHAMRGIQFAALVTPGPEGLQVSHVPMVLKEAGDGAWTLERHPMTAIDGTAYPRPGTRLTREELGEQYLACALQGCPCSAE